MKKKQMFKGLVQGAVATALTVSMAASSMAVNFVDTWGHWAESEIDRWNEEGVVMGYDGYYRPDNYIKRGDMAIMLNQVMEYHVDYVSGTHPNWFPNVTVHDLIGNYYDSSINRLHTAWLMIGSDSYVRPEDFITRQEAAVMLAKAFHLDTSYAPSSSFYSRFGDSGLVSNWALNGVYAMTTSNDYMLGREGNMFAPQEPITRAEVAQILDKMINSFVQQPVNMTGGTYDGNMVINTASVNLSGDMRIKGDLIIAEGVADGDIHLTDVQVDGNIIIKGGSTNTIYLCGVTASSLEVSRMDAPTLVVLCCATDIPEITVEHDCIIDATDLDDGYEVGKVELNGDNDFSDKPLDVTVWGKVDDIINNYEPTNLTVSGPIGDITLNEDCTVNGTDYDRNDKVDMSTIPGTSATKAPNIILNSVFPNATGSAMVTHTEPRLDLETGDVTFYVYVSSEKNCAIMSDPKNAITVADGTNLSIDVELIDTDDDDTFGTTVFKVTFNVPNDIEEVELDVNFKFSSDLPDITVEKNFDAVDNKNNDKFADVKLTDVELVMDPDDGSEYIDVTIIVSGMDGVRLPTDNFSAVTIDFGSKEDEDDYPEMLSVTKGASSNDMTAYSVKFLWDSEEYPDLFETLPLLVNFLDGANDNEFASGLVTVNEVYPDEDSSATVTMTEPQLDDEGDVWFFTLKIRNIENCKLADNAMDAMLTLNEDSDNVTHYVTFISETSTTITYYIEIDYKSSVDEIIFDLNFVDENELAVPEDITLAMNPALVNSEGAISSYWEVGYDGDAAYNPAIDGDEVVIYVEQLKDREDYDFDTTTPFTLVDQDGDDITFDWEEEVAGTLYKITFDANVNITAVVITAQYEEEAAPVGFVYEGDVIVYDALTGEKLGTLPNGAVHYADGGQGTNTARKTDIFTAGLGEIFDQDKDGVEEYAILTYYGTSVVVGWTGTPETDPGAFSTSSSNNGLGDYFFGASVDTYQGKAVYSAAYYENKDKLGEGARIQFSVYAIPVEHADEGVKAILRHGDPATIVTTNYGEFKGTFAYEKPNSKVTIHPTYEDTTVAVENMAGNSKPTVTKTEDHKYTFTMPSLGAVVYVTDPEGGTPLPDDEDNVLTLPNNGSVSVGGNAVTGDTADVAPDTIVTVTPDKDKTVESVTVTKPDGTALSPAVVVTGPNDDGNYTFPMPDEDCKVEIVYEEDPEADKYKVTVPSGFTTVPDTAAGETVTVTLPDGVVFADIKVTPIVSDLKDNGDKTFSFTMPAGDVTVTVEEAGAVDYELSKNTSSKFNLTTTLGGTDLGATSDVAEGTVVYVTKDSAETTSIASVTLTGGATATEVVTGVWTFTMPSADCTVTVVYEEEPVLETNVIMVVQQDANGAAATGTVVLANKTDNNSAITPNSTKVTEDNTFSVTATAPSNYTVKSIEAKDASGATLVKTANGSSGYAEYTMSKTVATVTVTYDLLPVGTNLINVEPTTLKGYVVTKDANGDEITYAKAGDEVKVEVTAPSDATITSVKVVTADGSVVATLAVTGGTFTMPDEAVTIVLESVAVYTVTYNDKVAAYINSEKDSDLTITSAVSGGVVSGTIDVSSLNLSSTATFMGMTPHIVAQPDYSAVHNFTLTKNSTEYSSAADTVSFSYTENKATLASNVTVAFTLYFVDDGEDTGERTVTITEYVDGVETTPTLKTDIKNGTSVLTAGSNDVKVNDVITIAKPTLSGYTATVKVGNTTVTTFPHTVTVTNDVSITVVYTKENSSTEYTVTLGTLTADLSGATVSVNGDPLTSGTALTVGSGGTSVTVAVANVPTTHRVTQISYSFEDNGNNRTVIITNDPTFNMPSADVTIDVTVAELVLVNNSVTSANGTISTSGAILTTGGTSGTYTSTLRVGESETVTVKVADKTGESATVQYSYTVGGGTTTSSMNPVSSDGTNTYYSFVMPATTGTVTVLVKYTVDTDFVTVTNAGDTSFVLAHSNQTITMNSGNVNSQVVKGDITFTAPTVVTTAGGQISSVTINGMTLPKDNNGDYTYELANNISVVVTYEYPVEFTEPELKVTVSTAEKTTGDFVKAGETVTVESNYKDRDIVSFDVNGETKTTGSFEMPSATAVIDNVVYKSEITLVSNLSDSNPEDDIRIVDPSTGTWNVGDKVAKDVTLVLSDKQTTTSEEVTPNYIVYLTSDASKTPINTVTTTNFTMQNEPVTVEVVYTAELTVDVKPDNDVNFNGVTVTVTTYRSDYSDTVNYGGTDKTVAVPINEKVTLTPNNIPEDYTGPIYSTTDEGVGINSDLSFTMFAGADIVELLYTNSTIQPDTANMSVVLYDVDDNPYTIRNDIATYTAGTLTYVDGLVTINLTNVDPDFNFVNNRTHVTVENATGSSGASASVTNVQWESDSAAKTATVTFTLSTDLKDEADKLHLELYFQEKTVTATGNWVSGAQNNWNPTLVCEVEAPTTGTEYKVTVDIDSLTYEDAIVDSNNIDDYINLYTTTGNKIGTTNVPKVDGNGDVVFYVDVASGVEKIEFEVVYGFNLEVVFDQGADSSATYQMTLGTDKESNPQSSSKTYFVQKGWTLGVQVSTANSNSYEPTVIQTVGTTAGTLLTFSDNLGSVYGYTPSPVVTNKIQLNISIGEKTTDLTSATDYVGYDIGDSAYLTETGADSSDPDDATPFDVTSASLAGVSKDIVITLDPQDITVGGETYKPVKGVDDALQVNGITITFSDETTYTVTGVTEIELVNGVYELTLTEGSSGDYVYTNGANATISSIVVELDYEVPETYDIVVNLFSVLADMTYKLNKTFAEKDEIVTLVFSHSQLEATGTDYILETVIRDITNTNDLSDQPKITPNYAKGEYTITFAMPASDICIASTVKAGN